MTTCLVHNHPRILPAISWTRLNERYRPTVHLALLIPRAISFDLGHGSVPASDFLIDMNRLFEDIVVAAPRDDMHASDRMPRQGDRSLRLDEAGRVTLEPDISWWDGTRYSFVGDVKYKRVVLEKTAPNADLYQLLAYTVAADVPEGLLIYAAGDEHPVGHAVRHAGKTLEVRTLDLSGTPDDILARVSIVAMRIRELRR